MSVSHHLFWLISRAAGGGALLTCSAGVGLGLIMSMKLTVPGRRDLRPLHEVIALTTLALVLLHGVSLLFDSWLHPGLGGITIPFLGAYRPLWTGIGIISAYGLAALGLSYYFRGRIGAARWRRLHRLTAVFWALAVAHTIGAGSDAASAWFLIACGLLVVPAAALLILRWGPVEVSVVNPERPA